MKTLISTIAFVAAATLPVPASAIGSLADVTVYDRAEGRYLQVYHHEGRHYVIGKPGNEYQVRIANTYGQDVLAVLSVDGVNAVSGETATWEQTGYILRGGSSFDVKGWRKSLTRTAAFFFTEHQNSYAERTGRPENVGVIGVAVFRRKPQPPPAMLQERDSRLHRQEAPAAAAPSKDAAGASASAESQAAPKVESKLGTGHGRSETSVVRYSDFERASPTPDELITIHYDTYRNLVAQGVIRERSPRLAYPNPFPGQFVPDPR